jgi:poly-gamma-glutamate synthesis protein (capsule biosynthesis protein)
MSPKEFGASENSETAAIESTPEPSLSSTLSPTPTPTVTPTPEPVEIRATITAVGDILMHKAVIDDGLTNPARRTRLRFHADFKYVSAIFKQSDLAFANFEGTLAGPPYTGFPAFSAPDEIADALYDAGFRVMARRTTTASTEDLTGSSGRRPFFAKRASP